MRGSKIPHKSCVQGGVFTTMNSLIRMKNPQLKAHKGIPLSFLHFINSTFLDRGISPENLKSERFKYRTEIHQTQACGPNPSSCQTQRQECMLTSA